MLASLRPPAAAAAAACGIESGSWPLPHSRSPHEPPFERRREQLQARGHAEPPVEPVHRLARRFSAYNSATMRKGISTNAMCEVHNLVLGPLHLDLLGLSSTASWRSWADFLG